MEDAHIACLDLKIVTSGSQNEDRNDISGERMDKRRDIISKNSLDDIALFGVFDGHGGDFLSSL